MIGTIWISVMPNVLFKETCPYFHSIRKMRIAIDYHYIFEKV